MDKKYISLIKKRFPGLFSMVVKSPLLSRMVIELDRGRYWYCLLMQKPYFGTVILAGQTWEERKYFMRRLVLDHIAKVNADDFNLLEIGSWAGNSAVLWAEAIKSTGHPGKIICVDSWEPYLKTAERENINSATIIMDNALRKGKVFRLFLHNIKASGHQDIVHPIKANSQKVLPLLARESFDIVYVDGDHSYTGIMKDLVASSGLVVEGGIMCGDDLDIDVADIDRSYASQNKEIHMVVDPRTGRKYHPGVCLAVSDFFKGEVASYHGFWAMRKVGKHWKKVEIDLEAR